MRAVLRYKFVPDIATARARLRPGHLELAKQEADAGRLIMGGALDPLEEHRTGLLVFDSQANARRFALKDPYVVDEESPVVESWTILEWNVVAGSALRN